MEAMKRNFFKALYLGGIVLLALSLTFCKKPEGPEEDPTEQDDPEVPDIPSGAEVIHVSDLTIGPDEDIVLEVNQTKQLTCTVSPEDADDKSFRWSSEQPEFVTVDENGLVKAVAVGESLISAVATDGGVTDTKLVTVYKPQAEAFTSIKFTSPASGDSHYVFSVNNNIVVQFNRGETFQFEAKGFPEDADDEVEFVYGSNSIAFSITEQGVLKADGGCGKRYETDYANHYIIARSKKNPKVSTRAYIRIEGMNAERAVLRDDWYSFPMGMIHPQGRTLALRYTSYIGKGHTRCFNVLLEARSLTQSDSYSYGSIDFSIESSSGPVTFAKDGHNLLATVNPSATVSSKDKTVEAEVTIRVNGYKRTIPFIVCKYDPLFPKIGDGLSCTMKGYLDGGNRGNGVFEKPPYKEEEWKANAIIAYIGNAAYNSDPIYKDHCNGGIPGIGEEVYHGIVVPGNTGRLYRSSNPNGEIFSEDYDQLTNSDSWPTSWFTNTNWILYTSYNTSAFANTCAMVYRNRWCGTSHDVKPANFFVTNGVFCTGTGDKKLDMDGYSWESDFYGDYEGGNRKSGDSFNAGTKYSDRHFFHTAWLWPTLNDMGYIFYGGPFDVSNIGGTYGSTVYSSILSEKMEALKTCGKSFTGATPSYLFSYWVSQSADNSRSAPLVTINNANQITLKIVEKGACTAYVLPIAYF